MHPDRIQPRTVEQDADLPTHAACARCGWEAEVEAMRLWSERQRLRLAARAEPGGFRYAYGQRHFGVCEPCHGVLIRGGRIADVRRRRSVAILLAALFVGVALVLLVPIVLPQLMSAFWRTGAA